jgi:ArsR family transcriptional regulator, lead/cadmium/zinc/bismuth-responsive transcriptional repressor
MRNRDIGLRKDGARLAQHAQRPDEVLHAASAVADPATYRDVANLFAVLADPTRVSIVHLLTEHELCTADVALLLDLNAPAASQHLRVLRDQRLVTVRREGRVVLYRLDDARVAGLLELGMARSAGSE